MNKYLKRILLLFIVPLLGFLYILGMMYFYDPLQLFSEKYPEYYPDDFRISAKKVALKNDFNGIIIGSSILVNQNPKELIGDKYINFSLTGSSIKERIKILTYLMNLRKINTIIISLDGNWISRYPHDIAYKLYEDNSFFDLIRIHYSMLEKKCIFLPLIECKGKKTDNPLEIIRLDFDGIYKFNEQDFQPIKFKNNLDSSYGYELLEEFILKNPNVQFHIIMPPYSTLYYINRIKSGDLKTTKEFLIIRYKHFIKNLSSQKNVKIYFFGNEKFTDNINNYHLDAYHYKHWINSRINKAINEGTNIITKDNMDEEFDKFIKKVENYDIKVYEEALRLDIRE